MRTLKLLNAQHNPYQSAPSRNDAGFPSFQRSPKEEYLQVLLTNTLTGTYYSKPQALLQASLSLHESMSHAAPEFMARALVYARQKGLMRLQPILGLVFLSQSRRDLFEKVFAKVIFTPHDLASFIEILRGGMVSAAFSRRIKRQINLWLNQMSEYHALKYANGGSSLSLKDILALSHPHAANPKQAALFQWLRHGTLDSELLPQIQAFASLKSAQTLSAQTALIESGKLPYEIITGFLKPDVKLWASLMQQMPYLALIRHLKTFQRIGLFQAPEAAEYIARRLNQHHDLQKARILPFQIQMAWREFVPISEAEKAISQALENALESSVANLPNLGERVCIAPDVSGSMTGYLSMQGKTTYIDIAALLAAACFKLSANAIPLPFDTSTRKVEFLREASVLENAQAIIKLCGGGTAISAPISKLLADKQIVDCFIGITDNIEWAVDAFGNHGFLPTWNRYKKEVAPHAKAFLLTIAPYYHAIAPVESPDIHYIYGWNEQVLSYISLMQQDATSQVQAIERMSL